MISLGEGFKENQTLRVYFFTGKFFRIYPPLESLSRLSGRGKGEVKTRLFSMISKEWEGFKENQTLRVYFCLISSIQASLMVLISTKIPACAGFDFLWRRRRDSNSRYSFPYTHFPGVLLQPLGHVSVIGRQS